ncbi:hypothetical protein AB1Y20_001702 [Prymnesium parvum]|uniref:Uncharacterized protein n=1 Tax=Prymnesium parvum TaxID=97485 RepID=A0AB34KD87_PRYPA
MRRRLLLLLAFPSPRAAHAENFIDWISEGGSCSAHCGRAGAALRCLAACGADGPCGCADDEPWQASRCAATAAHAARPQLCSCGARLSDAAAAAFGASAPREPLVADEYVRRALRASADELCGEEGELDGGRGRPSLRTLADAVRRMRHCGMVVVRRAVPVEAVRALRLPFAEYLRGLHNGSVSVDGRTSLNEPYFVHKLDEKRWELLLPRSFAAPELFNSVVLRSLLSHYSILGKDYVLHSLGAALSESGSSPLHWHRDSRYPFRQAGVAGADAPSHAVTVLTPLLDITDAHGPTEFCVGTSHLAGLDAGSYRLHDPLLAPFMDDETCPRGLRHVKPELKMGDLLMFDYNLIHRSRPNKSPHMRTLLYLTFSRPWFKDTGNFDNAAQVEVAEEHRKAPCLAPLQFAVGSEQPRASPSDLIDLERVTRHARYAEVCAGETTDASPSSASGEIEDIPELFPLISERLRDAGYEFEEEEEEEEASEEEDGGEDDDSHGRFENEYCAEGGECEASPQNEEHTPQASAAVSWTRLSFACSARAYFSAPLDPTMHASL